ncbi:MAG: hypothetical protein WDN28_23520 [Chthoniobacter sp.]
MKNRSHFGVRGVLAVGMSGRWKSLVICFLTAVALIAARSAATAQKGVSTGDQEFLAKTVIEYEDGAGADAETVITNNLPRGDSSAAVHRIQNAALFEITVTAKDAKSAVERANQIALALQRLLSDLRRQITSR